MDLRFRLNLVIVLSMLLIALAGILFSVVTARHSVKKEVNASIKALDTMLEIGLHDLDKKPNPKQYLIDLISHFEHQRHLSIDLQQDNLTSGQIITISSQNPDSNQIPEWFTRLVRPEPQSHTRTIQVDHQTYQLILSDNPDDEINEAWGETRGLFYLLVMQSMLVWVLCHLILGQALKPLPTLLRGLERIQAGDYTTRLAEFSLPEYKQIADAFNHAMTSLEIKTAENHLLAQHSMNLQEQERRAIARELHDELAQSLAGIKGISSSILVTCPQSKQAVEAILEICDGLFSVIRSMMRRLRPSSLEELGLLASLQELIDDWQQVHTNCSVTLTAKLEQPIQGEELTIHLYRIVQESLNNISRHSHATHADIILCNTVDGNVRLTIRDNGCGFEKANISHGFGLLGIRERVESLNGHLRISTSPGGGTGLTVIVPLQS